MFCEYESRLLSLSGTRCRYRGGSPSATHLYILKGDIFLQHNIKPLFIHFGSIIVRLEVKSEKRKHIPCKMVKFACPCRNLPRWLSFVLLKLQWYVFCTGRRMFVYAYFEKWTGAVMQVLYWTDVVKREVNLCFSPHLLSWALGNERRMRSQHEFFSMQVTGSPVETRRGAQTSRVEPLTMSAGARWGCLSIWLRCQVDACLCRFQTEMRHWV